ncbi:class E sortase [Streptomyces sp. NPDC051940]|uniref:class E sortase n=1 Tax=Streptomyces sp. NPDC051940 TaxID=3155675 RepID=UPI00341DF1BB
MFRPRALPAVLAALLAVLLACTPAANPPGAEPHSPSRSATERPPPDRSPSPAPKPPSGPREARLTISAIGVRDLRVVPYRGTTDDRAGTRIQNRGVAASPYGPRGGVGPGDVGNYLITAHRLSAGGPLRDLPDLAPGAEVLITAGRTVYAYEITATRRTSFRSPASLAGQRAAVPGAPGRTATRPMITLSTCLTPEDNAAGNFWRDANGNPEHRVDKIGVLTGVRGLRQPGDAP